MVLLLYLWRIVAIPLALSVYAFAVLTLSADPINLTALIIWCAVGYLLSLSTLIRAVHKKVMYRGGGYRFLMYLLMMIVNVAAMPVTLMLSVFGRIYRLINYNRYERSYDENDPKIRKRLEKRELKENAKEEREAQRIAAKELARRVHEDAKDTKRKLRGKKGLERELIANDFYKKRSEALGTKQSKSELKRAASANDISDRIRGSMWRASTDRAVRKILDDSYKGDIRIDDGVDSKLYKQVALINLNMQKYALLAEYDESGIPSREADIFAIVPSSAKGNTLTLVEDADLAEKIFSVYRTLLAERRLYNA